MHNIPTLSVFQPVPLHVTPPHPSPITFPSPLSYEFQVVEHVDAENKVTKVALQVKVNQHDQYGGISVHGAWADVPRVQIKL